MLKKLQLKNGMKVRLLESHKSPVISLQVWVRTGSADEQKGEEGISHFIEHLVFKGTEKFKVGEIARTIEGAGGELNAYTSFDQTVFYITISKHYIDVALDALSEMMGFPLFTAEEVENEREVVVEEIKRGLDSPGRRASQLLFSTAYQGHPYSIPVIGYEKNVRSWPVQKIVKFYQSRYVPRNMFFVMAGDFSSKEMIPKIREKFGRFKDFTLKKRVRKKEKAQKNPRLQVETASFEQSMTYISWKAPSVKHKDTPALDLLAMIFGQGETSRLVKRLRIDEPLVNSIGSSLFSPQENGLFVVSFSYNKQNLDKILAALSLEFKKLLAEEPTLEQIKRAIVNLESEQFYGLETVDGLSRKIGNSEFLMGDVNYFEKYLKEIRQVKPKDLLRVAKKYLVPQTMVLSALTNDEKVVVEKKLKAFVQDIKKTLKTLPKPKVPKKEAKAKLPPLKMHIHKMGKENEIQEFRMKNGTRVLMRPNFESYVVSARAAFLGGVRAEPDSKEGLTELLSRTWLGGTSKRSEEQISLAIEEMAAGLSPLAGRNSIGLGLEVLKSFESQGRDLFIENLVDPQFPEIVFEREKLIQLEQIKSRNDNPAQICMKRFSELIFEGHPYGKDMLGSEESLMSLKTGEIKSLWQKMAKTENLTLMVAGPIHADEWEKALREIEKDLPKGGKFSEKFPIKIVNQDRMSFEKVEKEQSHLVCGYQSMSLTDPDKYVLQIIQSILAGQGGRLFIELRDKQSLAYSVSPLRLEGIEGGYFGAYIGCSPDKVKKALQMMEDEFAKLMNEKVPQEELTRAQKYLVGRHDIDLQKTSAISSSVLYDAIYGMNPNETFAMDEKVLAVTAQDIMRVAQKVFSQNKVVSLVGPNNPLV